MIVSNATAVFPVWRSPMISSRWPRPMGIIESMALIPVCKGSFTERRSTTPGAIAFTDRDRHDASRAAHFVAFFDLLIFAEQHRTNLVFFQVQRDAGDAVWELHH